MPCEMFVPERGFIMSLAMRIFFYGNRYVKNHLGEQVDELQMDFEIGEKMFTKNKKK